MMTQHNRKTPRGFTLIELQVAIILLAFGVVTLASLMTTQSRLMHRLRGDFKPGATIYLTRNSDPWVKQLGAPAQISTAVPSPTSPPSVTAHNSVSIVTKQSELTTENITVTADVTEIP